MSKFSRPQFDARDDFFATRAFVFASKSYAPNDPFDKASADLRRLRQMYDTRQLRSEKAKAAPAPKSGRVRLSAAAAETLAS